MESGELIYRKSYGQSIYIHKTKFSPDGSFIVAIYSDSNPDNDDDRMSMEITTFETSTMKELWRTKLEDPYIMINKITFSQNGKTLCISTNKQLIWLEI